MKSLSVFLYLMTFLIFCGCGSKEVTKVTGVCKSCKPYWVRGEYHEPQDYYEYDYCGQASWYGPGFHGKKKANGETFNQDDYTAAHTELPLPTVVRVTNLNNHKKMDLVVTDRGPFVYGRSIDLSKAAAKKLGCYQKGTAPVRIQSLVLESKALADYIKENGTRGRTWRKVYEEEIAKRFDDEPYED